MSRRGRWTWLVVLAVAAGCGLARAPSPHLDAPGACAPAAGPRLCLTATPDRPLRLVVELEGAREATILPGECLAWPSDAPGGLLRLRLHESGRLVARRTVRLSPGRTTTWAVSPGRRRIRRTRCGR